MKIDMEFKGLEELVKAFESAVNAIHSVFEHKRNECDTVC